jgi:alginate O-acetyltransferase complex protein AlgI
MLFPTIDFAIFFALVFLFTWCLNNRNSVKKWFLVAVSYFFYAFWRMDFTLILLTSSLVNFGLALFLGRTHDGPVRLALLWGGVSFNLGLLVMFKYYNFFVASILNVLSSFGYNVHITFVELGLPIAISFITFHALSYIIDVYRRELQPTRSVVDLLLYISFFPHLIAGPIVRAKAFLQQTVHQSDSNDIRLGFSVFLIVGGLFKKVIVANYISTDFLDRVFHNPADCSRLDLLLGMYAYALQIYCDFSAYNDIAIAVANLLGYQFPQNFNQPYRALTVQDFWRRWHMTLSSWLRDYLYIPLGGSRGSHIALYRNIMITMALGGLWHGASFNFVIWGLLHGLALVLERLLGVTGQPNTRRAFAPISWVITLHFICFSWVFFRAPSFEHALTYLTTLVTGDAIWSTTVTPLVACMLMMGAMTHVIPTRWSDELVMAYDRASTAFKIAVPSLGILLVAVAAPSGVPPFIYFQF